MKTLPTGVRRALPSPPRRGRGGSNGLDNHCRRRGPASRFRDQPDLRPRRALLYEPLSRKMWRIAYPGGWIGGSADEPLTSPLGRQVGPAGLPQFERKNHGQGHRHRPRHHQFVRRRHGRQDAESYRERRRHAHHAFDRRLHATTASVSSASRPSARRSPIRKRPSSRSSA